jgi:hypothetical protein
VAALCRQSGSSEPLKGCQSKWDYTTAPIPRWGEWLGGEIPATETEKRASKWAGFSQSLELLKACKYGLNSHISEGYEARERGDTISRQFDLLCFLMT